MRIRHEALKTAPYSPLRLSDAPDHRQRLAFAHRRRAEDVKHFAGEWRAQFINPGAEEIGDVAHQSALDYGVTFFDHRIEDTSLVASQHGAAINEHRVFDRLRLAFDHLQMAHDAHHAAFNALDGFIVGRAQAA